MKWWIKILVCLALSVTCLFTCVGYAWTSSEMRVEGTAEAVPPDAVFISSISNVVTNNATINTSPINIGFPSTKVLGEIVFGGKNATVSFDAVVVNNTEFNQYFDIIEEFTEMEGVEGSFSYANVSASASIAQGTMLQAGASTKITITLKYTGSQSKQTRRMLHEIKFVMSSDDLTEAVSHTVTDQFANILNNRLEESVTYTVDGKTVTVSKDGTYEALKDMMDDTTSLSGKYIGNLSGSKEEHKALLTALFEGILTFKVGNEEVPVTVMIKEKDVYGSSTKELVLFITADTLSESRAYVPIYAVVFAQANGEWVQVGDILQGEAQVTDYSGLGATLGYGTGSFNTEKWRSTEVYYGVAVGKDIEDVMSGYEKQNP